MCAFWFGNFSAPSGITRPLAPPQTHSLESSVFDARALDYRIRLSINCSVRPTTNYPARCTVWAIPSEHLFRVLASLANRPCRGGSLQGQHAINISAVQSQTCAVENSAFNMKVPSVMPNHRARQSPSHTSPLPTSSSACPLAPNVPPSNPRRPETPAHPFHEHRRPPRKQTSSERPCHLLHPVVHFPSLSQKPCAPPTNRLGIPLIAGTSPVHPSHAVALPVDRSAALPIQISVPISWLRRNLQDCLEACHLPPVH